MFCVLAFGGFALTNLLPSPLSGWAIGELLINYEGGFVRRGLFGQLFFETGSPLKSATLTQQIIVSLFFIGCSFLMFLWRDVRSAIAVFALLMFAPGALFDMVSSAHFEYLDRKEIWFYVSLIITILYAKLVGFFRLSTSIVLGLISSLMILNHELYFLYFSVPIAAIYLFAAFVENDRRRAFQGIFYLAINTAAFLLVVSNSGTPEVVSSILASYHETDARGIEGGIAAIGWNFSHSYQLSVRMVRNGSLIYYGFFMLIAFLLVIHAASVVARNPLALILSGFFVFWLLVAVAASALSGWDWGRWISMYGIGFFLLLALLKAIEGQTIDSSSRAKTLEAAAAPFVRWSSNNVRLSFVFVPVMIAIGIMTRMSHCCPRQLGDLFNSAPW
jgi:hypothetical protein